MADSVYLGIDLGSSRTSISSSTGVRKTVWSYVGYPQDHVARKKFGGRDIVFGKEAVDNRMALNLIRPLEGGAIKMQGAKDDTVRKAVKDLLAHVVSLANAPKDATIHAVIGAPAEASHEGKAAIIDAARDCTDSVIVCSEPFAVAYGLDFLEDTLVIDIGAGTTDLCRVHGTMPKPEDGRTHSIAGDAIDKLLADHIKKAYPEAQYSINMIREFKEQHSTVIPIKGQALVTMPVKGKPTEFDISAEIVKACSAIVKPTVEALQDLIATYDPEFQVKMRNHVLLGGGGSMIRGLPRAIEEGLNEFGGGKVTLVEDPQYAGANGALQIALDMPSEYWLEFKQEGKSKKAGK